MWYGCRLVVTSVHNCTLRANKTGNLLGPGVLLKDFVMTDNKKANGVEVLDAEK
jgi:hypothetical protein